MGIDPGFHNIGFAFAKVNGTSSADLALEIVGMGAINPDGLNAVEWEDSLCRCAQVAERMRELLRRFQPAWIAIERPPANMARIAILTGAIYTVIGLERWRRVVLVTPQEIQRHVCGKSLRDIKQRPKKKAAVLAAMQGRFPELDAKLEHIEPRRREHAVDALGAILTAAIQGAALVEAA